MVLTTTLTPAWSPGCTPSACDRGRIRPPFRAQRIIRQSAYTSRPRTPCSQPLLVGRELCLRVGPCTGTDCGRACAAPTVRATSGMMQASRSGSGRHRTKSALARRIRRRPRRSSPAMSPAGESCTLRRSVRGRSADGVGGCCWGLVEPSAFRGLSLPAWQFGWALSRQGPTGRCPKSYAVRYASRSPRG